MNWPLFFSTFAIIFIAELPDKTSFAGIVLATRFPPLAVFIGGAVAFAIQSFVAVIFGGLIGKFPPEYVHRVAGVLFLVFAALMWRKRGESGEDDVGADAHAGVTFPRAILQSFMVFFIAEWGDLTQIATATLEAEHHEPLTLFVAATLALWTAIGLAVSFGSLMRDRIKPRLLSTIAAVVFAAAGVWMLVESFRVSAHP